VVDDINSEGKHDDEKPEKKDSVSSSSSTYFNRQSSTKIEAVARYVELPVLNHFELFVTLLSNPGPEKPEERDVMIDANPEDRHDDKKIVKKQFYEHLRRGM
jgi:hypothetical protein